MMFGEPKEIVYISGYGEAALDPPAAKAYYNEVFGYKEQIEQLQRTISKLESDLRYANQKIETNKKLAMDWKEMYNRLDEKLDHAKNDYYHLWAQINPHAYPPKPNW